MIALSKRSLLTVKIFTQNQLQHFFSKGQSFGNVHRIANCIYAKNIQCHLFASSKDAHIQSTPNLETNSQTMPKADPFQGNKKIHEQLMKLEEQYKESQNITIFEPILAQSTKLLEQMNLFKIFKILQASKFNLHSYQYLFDWIQNKQNIPGRKSDNLLLLLSAIKERIAKYQFEEQKSPQQSLKTLEEALDILEYSLVPPLFPYYSLYREYGLIHYELGNLEKSKQVLLESVSILDSFVSHSDDNVSSDKYCKGQAMSYNRLVELDPTNKKEWLQKSNKIWEKFSTDKFEQKEYARTVAENLKLQLINDEQKGTAYYHFHVYKFQNPEFKEMLKEVKKDHETRKPAK